MTDRLHRKMCLSCGHDGSEIQGQLAATSFICPSCGADLYARPPRTYAEMEGLVARAPAAAPTTFDRLSRLLVSAKEAGSAAQRRKRRRARAARIAGAAAALVVATVAAAAVVAAVGAG